MESHVEVDRQTGRWGRERLPDFPRNYVSRPDSTRNGSKGAKLWKPAVTGDPRPILFSPFKSRDRDVSLATVTDLSDLARFAWILSLGREVYAKYRRKSYISIRSFRWSFKSELPCVNFKVQLVLNRNNSELKARVISRINFLIDPTETCRCLLTRIFSKFNSNNNNLYPKSE